MKYTRFKICAMVLSGLGITAMQAQETIPASGGNASGSGGTVSYSVGQIGATTHTGITGSVSEGVQQPYEISDITGIREANGIILNCAVYPNPATDFLTLKVEGSAYLSIRSMAYQLCDAGGKILENKNLSEYETIIAMTHLAPATYFLKVVRTSQDPYPELKVFKIIKK